MIKTFAYNEFEFEGYNLDKSKALEDIDRFIKSGGNLNYPVKYRDNFIPASKFLEEQLGQDIVTKFFQNDYLESPGNWKLNEKTKTIEESKTYHSYWYRDNYSKYSQVISDGFRKLCQSFVSNPIYHAYEYKDEYNSSSKNTNHIVRYENCHPLVNILLRMPFKEMVNTFLEEVPNAKELLHEEMYRKQTVYENLIGRSNDSDDILLSLFKYQIVDVNTLIENYKFDDVIKKAISENDFDFINLLRAQSDNPHYIGELDKDKSMYDCFLRRVNTPEMAKILIDSGCPIIKKNDQYDSVLFSHEYFSIYKLEVIKFIMDYVPMDYMGKYENIFWEYLEKTSDLNQFKKFSEFIVSKGFPLEKYDLFNVCPGNSWEEKIKTCLDLGANPNNCQNLIKKLVTARDTSSFKAIQKTKLLNLYSPDGIFYLLEAESHTKGTLDLLDKAEIENINALTSFGKPAWFAANSKDKFHKILKKIHTFNQLDSHGGNWLNYYYSQDKKDKYEIASIVFEMGALEENKNHKLLNLTYHEGHSNVLHNGFNFGYKNKELRDEFVTMIKSFNTTNLNELFDSLDADGLFPIDHLIASKSNDNIMNSSFWDAKLDTLLRLTEFNLDYDSKNKDGKTLYEQLKHYYSISNTSNAANFIEPIENAYSKYQLYNKLEHKLVPDNRKTTKVKI